MIFPTETQQCSYSPTPETTSCKDAKPVISLTMVWDGPDGVNIVTEGGEVFNNVQNGEVVTFSTAGLGNDVELSLSGSVNGQSEFHVSCSDDEMDGPEDCGSPQGNNKKNESGLINQFLFAGLTGEDGGISCPGVAGGGDSTEVVYGFRVTNPNDEALSVTLSDNQLGINEQLTIAANSVLEIVYRHGDGDSG